MLVRFKREHSGLKERIRYELETEELAGGYLYDQIVPCYNTKALGLIPAIYMEEASEEDIPAIDVIVKIKNEYL